MKNAVTISAFAKEIGADRHTLAARIEKMGITPAGKVSGGKAAGSNTYRIRNLVRAAAGGDEVAERLRKTREEADKLALQNARSRGELVELTAVEALARRCARALTSKILSFPLSDAEKDRLLKELVGFKQIDWRAGS